MHVLSQNPEIVFIIFSHFLLRLFSSPKSNLHKYIESM